LTFWADTNIVGELRDELMDTCEYIDSQLARKQSTISQLEETRMNVKELNQVVQEEEALVVECQEMMLELEYLESIEKSMMVQNIQLNDRYFKTPLTFV
jgi:predicted nuclease with TOPRIM domain